LWFKIIILYWGEECRADGVFAKTTLFVMAVFEGFDDRTIKTGFFGFYLRNHEVGKVLRLFIIAIRKVDVNG
jgi:hypothetical protein